jgi:hypothetical protein
MRVFFPIEDAGIDDLCAVPVPYQCGLPCAHELRAGLVLRDGVWTDRALLSAGSAARRPDSRPACAPDPR